ncbi:hypothetical protein J1N35_037145, partial [Gossypium stocksii]
GLLKAIYMLFPNAETRYCVRHLHANFKKAGFRTKELKDLLWKATRVSTLRDFEDVMVELKNTNQHAYDWLKEKNPTHWSRFHFSIKTQSDMLVLLEVIGKPILTMMETIRTKIILLIFKKKEKAKKWKGMLCPKIRKKLDVNIKDLLRNWDLTSIPCIHVVAVIHLKYEFLKTHVQNWLVRGPKQWLSVPNMLPILPPTLRRQPSRPTKVRWKEHDEPQIIRRLSKKGVDMRCSKCNKIGHKKRSGKGEVGQKILISHLPLLIILLKL